MATLFSQLLEAFDRASRQHSQPADDAGLPDRTWKGWLGLAEQLGVLGDSPAYRVRQAVKIVLAANQLNLTGKHVDWDALEQHLAGITAGFVTLSQLPTTQEDMEHQAQLRDIIIFQDALRGTKKKARSYCVVLEGQDTADGEWYTHDELKKHFPDSYRSMKNDYEIRRAQQRQEQEQEPAGDRQDVGGDQQRAVAHAGSEPSPKGLTAAAALAGNPGEPATQQRREPASNLASNGGERSPESGAAGGAEAAAMSSAGKHTAPAPAPAIPGASCVPRKEQPPAQPLFQESGPPASMMLAGILLPAKPVPAAAVAAQPAKRRPGRPRGTHKAQQKPQAVRQVIYPALVGITQLTAAAEPVIRGRIQQSTVMLRPQRTAPPPSPPAPTAAVATATGGVAPVTRQQQQARPGSGVPSLALSPECQRPRVGKPPLPSPVQQPSVRQQQRQPALAGLAMEHSRLGAGQQAPQAAPGVAAAGAAGRASAALQPSPSRQLHQLPPVDFSSINPLLRRNAEYVYCTTGQLPPGAVRLTQRCQQQQERQQPAKAGLDALLQLLPKPRGSSLPPAQQRPAPAVAPVAPAFSPVASLAPPLVRGSPVLPGRLVPPRAGQQLQRGQRAPAPTASLPGAGNAAAMHQLRTAPAPDPASPGAAPSAMATVIPLGEQQQAAAGLLRTPPIAAATEGEEERFGKRPRVAEPLELPEARGTPPTARGALPAAVVEPPASRTAPAVQQQQQQPVPPPEQPQSPAPAAPADSWAFAPPPSAGEEQGMQFMWRFGTKAVQPLLQQQVPAGSSAPAGSRPPGAAPQAEAVQQQSRAAAGGPASSDQGLNGQGEDAFYDAQEELPSSQPSAPEWDPMSHPNLRTQPDEVLWTAADAAGVAGLDLTQQQAPVVPPTQEVCEESAATDAQQEEEEQQVIVVPDTEEEEQLAAEQTAAGSRCLEGRGRKRAANEREEEEEDEEEGGREGKQRDAPPLKELLDPEAWSMATIKGAKTCNNEVQLWIEWDYRGGHKAVVASSALLGRPHCMETLIRFYESKTRQQKRRRGAGSE